MPADMLQWQNGKPVELPDRNFAVGSGPELKRAIEAKLHGRGHDAGFHIDSFGDIWHNGDPRTVKAISDSLGYGGGKRPSQYGYIESVTHGSVKPRAIQVGNIIFGHPDDASLVNDLSAGGANLVPVTEIDTASMNGLASRITNALHALFGVPLTSRVQTVPTAVHSKMLGQLGQITGQVAPSVGAGASVHSLSPRQSEGMTNPGDK